MRRRRANDKQCAWAEMEKEEEDGQEQEQEQEKERQGSACLQIVAQEKLNALGQDMAKKCAHPALPLHASDIGSDSLNLLVVP